MSNKKHTIKTLMESIPEFNTNTTELKLEGDYFKDITLRIQYTLPLEDAVGFVKDVTATCVDDEQVEYMPELFDFAMRMYVLMYYANVDLSKDVKKAYRILYGTTIFEQVCECINPAQYDDLISSAEKRIEHWKNIISSSVAGKVSEMMSKLDEVMSSGREVMDAFNGDEFKSAVARLADAGILGLDNSPTDQGAPATPGDIVYIKKNK